MSDRQLPFRHYEGVFPARDGLLLFEQYWQPEHTRAVVVIVHGYAEHSSRYASVAARLAGNDYSVYTFDLRGHGRSPGARCFVKRFEEYSRDLEDAVLNVRKLWPDKQIFLLAHSMGGLISTLYAAGEDPGLGGIILSAPSLTLGNDFSPFKIRLVLFLSRWFPRLPTFHLKSSSISRDEEVVRMYREDEFVYHGRIPVRTAAEIIRATNEIQDRMERIGLPLLILHGGDDRMADLTGSRQLYASARSNDKQLEVFDQFYHEVMNEPERGSVIKKIFSWLDRRAPV